MRIQFTSWSLSASLAIPCRLRAVFYRLYQGPFPPRAIPMGLAALLLYLRSLHTHPHKSTHSPHLHLRCTIQWMLSSLGPASLADKIDFNSSYCSYGRCNVIPLLISKPERGGHCSRFDCESRHSSQNSNSVQSTKYLTAALASSNA